MQPSYMLQTLSAKNDFSIALQQCASLHWRPLWLGLMLSGESKASPYSGAGGAFHCRAASGLMV